jgi:non-canonical (house-cleaning) NTP pyrophosphatase
VEERFDALAYAEHLRRLLVDRQPLSDQELSELAAARATNAREAIVTDSPELEARIEVVESNTVSRDESEPVRMQMVLTTSAAGVEQ